MKLKAITKVIHKAVPEIIELKFGCEFTDSEGSRHFITHVSQNHPCWLEARTDGSNYTYRDFEKKGRFEILGRDITLEDVFKAMIKKKKFGWIIGLDGEFIKHFSEGNFLPSEVQWEWGVPLHLQKPEVWEFLLKVLVKKI